MRLTFGELIEIGGLQDEIYDLMEKKTTFGSNLISVKLQRISKISKEKANETIVQFGLDKQGWKQA